MSHSSIIELGLVDLPVSFLIDLKEINSAYMTWSVTIFDRLHVSNLLQAILRASALVL
jgi:hypothetical protein